MQGIHQAKTGPNLRDTRHSLGCPAYACLGVITADATHELYRYSPLESWFCE